MTNIPVPPPHARAYAGNKKNGHNPSSVIDAGSAPAIPEGVTPPLCNVSGNAAPEAEAPRD